jgi:hypothetical protein
MRARVKVVRFHGQREGQVGLGVFMPTVNLRVVRQLCQTLQRRMHHPGAALEQPSAAGAEQGVAAEQRAAAVQGDVTEGVTGNGDDVEIGLQAIHVRTLGVVQRPRQRRDRLAFMGRTIDRHRPALAQAVDAMGMVPMMVRHQNRPQCQPLRIKPAQDGFRLAGVHHDGCVVLVSSQGPDIIVF